MLRIFHPAARECVLTTEIVGWGYARLASESIAPLRKTIPAWAPNDTPTHFFKYSDEQTVVAAHAVSDAIARCGLVPNDWRNWGIITAPQFLGRVSGAGVFRRFRAGGASAVSPHTIPQHSLHSVSGALSVLLAGRGPNVGVGGGPNALAEGLLAATTLFDGDEASATWLVCTGWNPEPLPNPEGNANGQGVCHAFALALQSSAATLQRGELSIEYNDSLQGLARSPHVSDVVDQLITCEAGSSIAMQWQMSGGARARLSLLSAAASDVRAA
jgi:hypothetical protein